MPQAISQTTLKEASHLHTKISFPKLKHPELFDKYLKRYEALPSAKKLLANMIKFEEMYKPIVKGSLFVDTFGYIQDINEQRKLKRAQIYLNQRDLIAIFDKKRGKRLVVTSRGHKIFYEDYPLAKLRKEKWDGIWTVIMYDFPETERVQRGRLRRKLMSLGFGGPQISILVSPLSIEEPVQKLLEGEGVTDKVWVLRATRILGMENHEVVRRAWPMVDEINKLYLELLRVLPDVRRSEALSNLWGRYFSAVNSVDPYLPPELLPEDWSGEICHQEFSKLTRRNFLQTFLGGSSEDGGLILEQ